MPPAHRVPYLIWLYTPKLCPSVCALDTRAQLGVKVAGSAGSWRVLGARKGQRPCVSVPRAGAKFSLADPRLTGRRPPLLWACCREQSRPVSPGEGLRLRGEVGQPNPEDAPQPPSPPTRRDRERCSLPAGLVAGMSQRRRHHRRRRPGISTALHSPPPKSALEAEGQQPPARSPPSRRSLGQHGGDRWERAGARRGGAGRGGRAGAGKVKVRGGAPGAGIGHGPCRAPERKVDPSQNPRYPREDEGRCYPDHHSHPALALRGAQACVYTRAHRGVEAADPAGSWRASGYPERAVALCPETTHELSQTAENHPQIKSSCSWLMLGAFAGKSNLLQQMFTERIRCALHSSLYQRAKMFAPQGPGSPRFLIMGAQIPPTPEMEAFFSGPSLPGGHGPAFKTFQEPTTREQLSSPHPHPPPRPKCLRQTN